MIGKDVSPKALETGAAAPHGPQRPPPLTAEQLCAAFGALPHAGYVLGESGLCLRAFGTALGEHPNPTGRHVRELFDTEGEDWFLERIRDALDTPQPRAVTYQVVGAKHAPTTESDDSAWFEARIQQLPGRVEGERAVIWIATDVTENRALVKRLRRMGEYDELTGVHNRRKFLAELAMEYERFRRYATPFALLTLDVDHLAGINERFGHLAGDQVLQTLAAVCRRELRKSDLLARYDGGRFVILLRGTPQATATAERIRGAVERHRNWLDDQTLDVSISIGTARPTPKDKSLAALIARADHALREAKAQGRNRVSAG
jgi:diguanylate cyclase (GGDEF)-like protein